MPTGDARRRRSATAEPPSPSAGESARDDGHPAAPSEPVAPPNGRNATRKRPAATDRAARRSRRDPVAELLQHAVEEAARLLDADGAIIYLLDESTGRMHFAHEAGITDRKGRRWVRRLVLPVGRGMFGVAAAERRAVHTADYPNDRTFRHSPDADRFVSEVGLRSLVAAPLVAGDRVFGALGTYSRRVGAFSEAQLGLVRALADHAAAAMANAILIAELDRSRREQERRAEREQTLREIAARITAIHDPAEVIQETVDASARLLGAEGARIDLIDPELGLLRWAYQSGADRPGDDIWPEDPDERLEQGVSGLAVTEGRVIVTGDYLADDRFVHRPGPDSYVRSTGIQSVIAAPLIGDRGPFGTLTIYTTRRDAWSAEDAAWLEALATEAAIALGNARLIEQLGGSREALARRAEAEQALREITRRITAVQDPAELLQLVIQSATRLVRADGGILDLLDPERAVLRWSFDTGIRHLFSPDEVDELWIPVGIGATGVAVAENRVVIEGENPRDQFPPSAVNDAFFDRTGFRSMIISPISSEAGPLGAIEVYSRRRNGFDESDAALIGSLADQAAIAIRNARLIEDLARSREENARRADAERTLREIAARITAIRDPDEILHQVLDAASRLLGATGAMINLVGVAGTDRGWAWSQEQRANFEVLDDVALEPQSGVSGLAIASGRVEISGDYLDDDRFAHSPERDAFVRDAGIRSVIAAPVMVGADAIGTITVYSPEADAFDDSDAALMKALADQAAVTISNAQLIEQLERAREEVERRADAERSLRQIAANISAIRDPDVVLQQTINEATRLLRADGGIIDLLDDDGSTLRWAYDTGMFREFDRERFGAAETQLGKGIAGRAVLERRVVRTGDYRSHEFVHTPTGDDFAEQLGIRSVIVAPILGESGPVGAIEIYARRVDGFDELDATVLSGLAEQAAIAIQNARLIEALDRSADEIRRRADAERALRQIAANITAIRDADVILQQTVDEAKRLLDSSDARIDLLEDGRRLRWRYTSELSDLSILRPMDETFELGQGVAGLVVAEGRPFRTGDYLADDRFPHNDASDVFVRAAGIRSALAVPLKGDQGVLGAISVATARHDAYDDGDVELLQALADQSTIAIQNAALIEELQRSRSELARRADAERSLREMAGRIAELRDPAELLRRIVEDSQRLLGSDGAHLTRLRDDGETLVPVVVAGELDAVTEAWLLGLEFPLMGGINGLAAGLGQPIWTEDYPADPRVPHAPDDDDVAERLGLRGMAAVPLRSPEGGTIGTLAVSFREPHVFDEDALALLKGLADHAAIALTNTHLYERLRESERRYRHLVQDSPDLIWAMDGEARLTFVSDTSERLTGYRPEELLGRHFGALVHESSREVAEIDWTREMFQPQQELRGRLNLRHRDGRAIPAEFTAMGALDDEGRFLGANGSVRDMTERDRLERELRDSEARFRQLVQTTPDTIWRAGADGTFLFMADSGEALFGWPVEELVGRHFEFLTDPASMPLALENFQAAAREPDVVRHVQLRLVRRDGSSFAGEVTLSGVFEDGIFAGAHGTVRDVTDRVTLEQDLRRQAAELAAGEERAHLARELHDSVTQALFSMTLLTRTIEMLLDRDVDQARDQLGALRELQREALAEMRALIFELRPGNLEQDGLEKALRTHAAALQGRIGLPIVVAAAIEGRLPIAVEEVLYRIAQEALHNVVKHAGAREVRIELGREGGGIRLRIVDDGRGFDPSQVGSGHLGLAGMLARAEKVGGSLRVSSRPGRGTTVEVVVAAEAIEAARRDTAAATALREIGVASSAE